MQSKLSELSKSSKLSLIYLTCLIGLSAFVVYAQSSIPPNSSLSLTKDPATGLFVLNMSDPEGIRSFSLAPQESDNLPYSGDISGCPRNRKIDNIRFDDPSDFEPPMKGYVYDCRGSEVEFNIEKTPAKVFKSTKVSPEPQTVPPPPPTTPPPSAGSKREEIKKEFTYPIPELGNCGSEAECKLYCDDMAHIEACLDFAERNGLLSEDELEKGKKFKEILKSKGGGPGGCRSEKECEAYCGDIDRIDECLEFAEKNNFVKGAELDEIKKIHRAVRAGKQFPGGCKTKLTCEAYCQNPDHIDECFAFAKDNGLMSEEELKEAEKFMPLIKSGQTPGACKTKEACEAYCESDEHIDECIDFAARNGMISPEELEMVKKTGGKGPGGCKGRACRDFCEKSENQKTCFEFAKEHGLMKEKDLRRMEEGKERLKKELENMPPEVRVCLERVLGPEGLGAIQSGEFFGGRDLGEKMKICFEESLPAEFKDKFIMGAEGEFSGPGGCKTRDECEAYCHANPDACGIKMPEGGGPPTGGGSGSFSGPGGCKSREECEAYCKSNPAACGGFRPPSSTGGESFPSLAKCSFMDFHPVCGQDNATHNNACFAILHGTKIAHEGACPGHQPCDATRQPVCGVKNGVIQNYYNACVAKGDNAEIKYQGECRSDIAPPPAIRPCPAMPTVNECPSGQKRVQVFNSPECGAYYSCITDFGTGSFTPPNFTSPTTTYQPTTDFNGPGGCKTAEECRTYCTQNYQDPACRQFMPSSALPNQSPFALVLAPFLELLDF